MKKLAIIIAAGLGAGSLFAQEETRAAEIAAQQEKKAAETTPVQQNKIERGLNWARESSLLDKYMSGSGFHPKVGGMSPETGVGLGAGYGWKGRTFNFSASGVASPSKARKFDGLIEAPKLYHSLFFAEVYAVHHNYPLLSYYGSGPDTETSNRSRYHLEDTAVDGRFGVRPVNHLSVGTSAGYVSTELDSGKARNYSRVAAFAQYDWRDTPGGARRGGNYFTQFSEYGDFRRLDMEAQQFVPFLNDRRVIALRAKTSMMFHDSVAPVPFYLQPMLGGAEDLRGYRPYRFRGDNVMVMNAEYRWEIFSGLDMAVFGDAGKVANRRSDLNFRKLEADAGFGFRFNARNRTFLRMDVGFSHEGFQIWVKFNDVFRNGPIHTSSSTREY